MECWGGLIDLGDRSDGDLLSSSWYFFLVSSNIFYVLPSFFKNYILL